MSGYWSSGRWAQGIPLDDTPPWTHGLSEAGWAAYQPSPSPVALAAVTPDLQPRGFRIARRRGRRIARMLGLGGRG